MKNGLLSWRGVFLVVGLALAGLAALLTVQLVQGGISAVTVRAGSGEVDPGQQVTIPVDTLNVPADPGQSAFTIEVKYDTNLLSGVSCTANPDGIWDFGQCSAAFAEGVARCTGISSGGVSGVELALCDIVFEANPDVIDQTLTPLGVNCVVKADPGGNALPCNEQPGEIKIRGVELPPVTVRAGSGTVQPGGNITIPVDALDVSEVPGQGAFTIEVKYDTNLLTGKDCTANPAGIWDFGQCSANFASGVARCTGISSAGISGAELRLCDIAFEASAVDAQTLTPLNVNCVVKADPGGNALTCLEEAGEIKIDPGKDIRVQIGSAKGPPGGNVTVLVEVLGLNETVRLGSATVDVQYDALQLTAKACDADPAGVLDAGLCEEAVAPDTARCVGIDGVGEPADVVLCTISFDISSSCSGVVPLTKVVVTLETNTGAPIPHVVNEGIVECNPQGDVNCDNLVNNVDTLFILQYVLGLRKDGGGCPLPVGPPPEPNPAPNVGWLLLEACDVDKDGDCDSTDALFVFQCVLNLKPGANMAFCIAASQVSGRPTSGIAGGLDLRALGRTEVSSIGRVA